MYRNLLGIGGVFAVALILVGITFSASVDKPADFRFINGTEPKSLDPHIMTGQPEGRIGDAIFEGLTYRHPKTLAPQPGVAERWDVSPDRRTYTFHLRGNARWSDGKPVTAHDFAWSWKRLQEPAIGSEYAYIHHMIKWAEIYNTYGGNATELVGPKEKGKTIQKALQDLMKEKPEGIDGKAWQRFLAKHSVNVALKNVPDPALQAALSFRGEKMTTEHMAKIEAAMVAEAARRRSRLALAQKHFGVDQGIFAKDERTFVVELNAPAPYFLEVTAFYASHPVPKHVIEIEGNADDWFRPEKIVSNGPYRMTDWRVNDKIRLVKSETYWNKDAIKLDIIDAYPIENYNTAMNLYLTGGADWSPTYPMALVPTLKKRDDFCLNSGMVVYYYRFNCTKPPLNNPLVRQAISLAVDRQLICDHVIKRGEKPALRLVPPGMPNYEPPQTSLGMDIERARKLLEEAGYPGGKGLPEIGLLYNTSESHEKIAEVVADQLRRNLGINVKAYNQEWQAYQASMLALDYDMARAGWIGDYADPNTFLDMWITNGGNNQTGWSNALYDRLIQFASDVEIFLKDPEPWIPKLKEQDRVRGFMREIDAATADDARVGAMGRLRMQFFREAEAVLFQEGFPVMPIYFYVVSNLVKPYVTGFYKNLQDVHPLRSLGIDHDANISKEDR